jgi:hypothetical protein
MDTFSGHQKNDTGEYRWDSYLFLKIRVSYQRGIAALQIVLPIPRHTLLIYKPWHSHNDQTSCRQKLRSAVWQK